MHGRRATTLAILWLIVGLAWATRIVGARRPARAEPIPRALFRTRRVRRVHLRRATTLTLLWLLVALAWATRVAAVGHPARALPLVRSMEAVGAAIARGAKAPHG